MADQDHENRKEEMQDHENRKEEEMLEDEGSSFSAFKVVMITLAIIIFIGVSIVGAGGYYIYSNLQPVDPESEEMIQVTIPMGSSASKIATILKEHDVIKHEQLFYYYIRFKGDSGFQAGDHYLSASMELDEIIEQLQEGNMSSQTTRFTIPEGWNVEQIADHLEKEGLVDKDTFLQVINEGDFSNFSFFGEIPETEDRKYRLEGFLFPETYEIYQGASEEQIIQVMLTQFEKEIKEEWRTALDERDMSFYELITLASIIEREAVLDEERPIVSGVFHNRLEDDWLLQSCATVMFALGKPRDRILFEDLEVESPYNTYIHEGLPPGPIASAGRSSIEAALFPEEHDYFFFVTKKDASGAHHFARTYEEHLQNDAQSRGSF